MATFQCGLNCMDAMFLKVKFDVFIQFILRLFVRSGILAIANVGRNCYYYYYYYYYYFS